MTLEQLPEKKIPENIVLMGVTGAGKSSSGWLLARLIGYGFIDLDQVIEAYAKKSIAAIFADDGEDAFRKIEKQCLENIKSIKHHVIAVGGGACVDDDNWELIKRFSKTVWLNCPSLEIAKRLLMKPDEIRKRPKLADLVEVVDKENRLQALIQRLQGLIVSREKRYKEADLALNCAHTTRETTAHLLRDLVLMRI